MFALLGAGSAGGAMSAGAGSGAAAGGGMSSVGGMGGMGGFLSMFQSPSTTQQGAYQSGGSLWKMALARAKERQKLHDQRIAAHSQYGSPNFGGTPPFNPNAGGAQGQGQAPDWRTMMQDMAAQRAQEQGDRRAAHMSAVRSPTMMTQPMPGASAPGTFMSAPSALDRRGASGESPLVQAYLARIGMR